MIATNPRPSALARKISNASLKFTTPNRARNASAPEVAWILGAKGHGSDLSRLGLLCLRLAYEHDERHADDGGEERDEEQRTDVARVPAEQLVHTETDQGSADRAGSVGRAMEAERPAAEVRRRVVGDQRVARRCAYPLPSSIDDPATSTNGHTCARPISGFANEERP